MNSDVFEISINLENKNSICSFNEVWYDDIRIQISTVDMLIRVFYHRWMKYTCIRRKPEKIQKWIEHLWYYEHILLSHTIYYTYNE